MMPERKSYSLLLEAALHVQVVLYPKYAFNPSASSFELNWLSSIVVSIMPGLTESARIFQQKDGLAIE
jgi:hypothetical protein